MEKYSNPTSFTKRPQLWMSYLYDEDHSENDRFRIIYPDGSVNWEQAKMLQFEGLSGVSDEWGKYPCWADVWHERIETKKSITYDRYDGMSGGPRYKASYLELIDSMHRYDASYGRKTIFLGFI